LFFSHLHNPNGALHFSDERQAKIVALNENQIKLLALCVSLGHPALRIGGIRVSLMWIISSKPQAAKSKSKEKYSPCNARGCCRVPTSRFELLTKGYESLDFG
jgi:hypothetical protein